MFTIIKLVSYRFGFRLNENDDEESSSLEEKAEKMRKQAQDQHQVAAEVSVIKNFCQPQV